MAFVPYIRIARPDHWFKNIFMVPGIILAVFFGGIPMGWPLLFDMLLGFVALCIVASSNYVINEIVDADQDCFHPEKKHRPIPSGDVQVSYAYVEWIGLAVLAGAVGSCINFRFLLGIVFLWFMGLLYNLRPFRLKRYAYWDVLSESVNNPIRMSLGWYLTGQQACPPLSFIIAYWMFGAFLMAAKRFAEYRMINDKALAAQYRESFAYYSEERLLVSMIYYIALFAMMAGIFIMRYRMELILVAPLIAYALAYYLNMSFKSDSVVQKPEYLYHDKGLVAIVLASMALIAVLLFWDMPWLNDAFAPWLFRQ